MTDSIVLPNFKVDPLSIPDVRIKSIRFQRFKSFEDNTFDFMDGDICKKFICFHGPNGCGKTTILDAVSMIFSKYDGRALPQLIALLGRSVRHTDGIQKAIYDEESDFLITAQIQCSLGDYEVKLTKRGFIQDHPPKVKDVISRLCFYAKFDQELHQFQLIRSKWGTFKELFGAVTGFEVEEKETVFNDSNDSTQSDLLKIYILGFMVKKPNEIISHKECSAGERKIIKSFSTLLNKEYMPSVVCIDNAEMHVESGRHIQLIESMKKCFPNSQIFATTHSYQISRNFGDRSQLYDLRLLKASELVKSEPWRLYISDEIMDSISKLKSVTSCKIESQKLTTEGENLLKECLESSDNSDLVLRAEQFLRNVSGLFIGDLISYYGKVKK